MNSLGGNNLDRGWEDEKKVLDSLMNRISEDTNKELGQDMLTEDGTVDMKSFRRTKNNLDAPYSKEEEKEDEQLIKDKELMWSGATNDSSRDFLRKKYNLNDVSEDELTDKILEEYRNHREASAPAILEQVATIVFYKVLKDKFFVMKSSIYDDYENGVDNLMVNKETGEVICAFDEVHGETKHRDERKKEEKIIKKAKQGGTKIKYGFTFKDNKDGEKELVRKEIDSVPLFYIASSPEDLKGILGKMDYDMDKAPNEDEINFFNKVTTSLKEQADMLLEEDIPEKVKKKIVGFNKFLEEVN